MATAVDGAVPDGAGPGYGRWSVKKRIAIAVGVILVLLIVAGRLKHRTQEPPPSTAAARLVRANAAPDAGTPDGSVYLFNARPRPGKGLFDAYIATAPHADRLHGRRLLAPWSGHRGAADVSDDGRYVLLVTARGADRTSSRAQPGKGSGNGIDLYDRRTGQLTTIVRGGCGIGCPRALIWPRFAPDPDGTGPQEPAAIHWSEQQKPPWQACCLGDWRQHITALAYGPDGRPRAAGDRVWDNPDGKAHIYETYGWIPGTDRVVFMSDNDVPRQGRGLFYGQLFTLPDSAFTPAYRGAASPRPERFTAPFSDDGKPVQANTEFAHFHPEHPGWLYTSVAFHSKRGTMDLWRYRYDAGGHPTGERQRVTYFGGTPRSFGRWAQRRGFPQPAFRVVGGIAPATDGGWIAGVCDGLTCERIDAYHVRGSP